MDSLEQRLDRAVGEYLGKVRGMEEVRALLSGDIAREGYVRFLRAFYVIEDLSRAAVERAARKTAESDPYLSGRLGLCARGEAGHAEIALSDLAEMGEGGVDVSGIPEAREYGGFLLREAGEFPPGILGHSYLFENASGIMFPGLGPLPYPSQFIEVHAKEDPGHSLAIKRTVRNVEPGLTDADADRVVDFARRSGDFMLRVFAAL